jgi:hypothetical protein
MSAYPGQQERARNWATFAAVLVLMAALLFLGAYPVRSIIIMVIDGVVIYALTVYGESLGTN